MVLRLDLPVGFLLALCLFQRPELLFGEDQVVLGYFLASSSTLTVPSKM